jgi:hypothetical protein
MPIYVIAVLVIAPLGLSKTDVLGTPLVWIVPPRRREGLELWTDTPTISTCFAFPKCTGNLLRWVAHGIGERKAYAIYRR